MTNSYIYSIKVNEALERYGAKTHGSLARRVERLKRFTDMKNRKYADEIRLEDARMIANQEREERLKNRVRDILLSGTGKTGRQSVARNLAQEFENASGWYAMGSPNYLKNTDIAKMKKETYLAEPSQSVEIPFVPSNTHWVTPEQHRYNLRPRQENGLNLLWRAIQNGFVNPNRG